MKGRRMDVPFAKMHGAGNDFVVIDDRAARGLSRGAVAALCDRRRGIGADGLILVLPGGPADFRMRYYNSDGGEADMCGNGARCAARFAHDRGIAGAAMAFESRAGIVRAEIDGADVRVWIGPVTGLRLRLSLEGVPGEVHFGVCGVPHAVVVERDAGARPRGEFSAFARRIRAHPGLGPAGANVNVVSVADRRRCAYRTYERGVEDETLACGTGAVVVTTVLAHLGLAEASVACATAGGDTLLVDVVPGPAGATETRLAGPAVVAFRGTFSLEDYERP
jgi:diaminopimelate epimerase